MGKNKQKKEVSKTVRYGRMFAGLGVVILTIGFGAWILVRLATTSNNQTTPESSDASTEASTVMTTESPYHRNEVLAGTGIDTTRVYLDEQKAKELFTTIFTWGDGVTYNKAREELLKHMSEEEANRMMPENTVVTPGMVDGTVSKDMWYTDVMGLNSEFEKAKFVVSGFDSEAQVYHYIAIVEVTATSEEGHEGKATYVMTFDTDVNNNISNMGYNAVV